MSDTVFQLNNLNELLPYSHASALQALFDDYGRFILQSALNDGDETEVPPLLMDTLMGYINYGPYHDFNLPIFLVVEPGNDGNPVVYNYDCVFFDCRDTEVWLLADGYIGIESSLRDAYGNSLGRQMVKFHPHARIVFHDFNGWANPGVFVDGYANRLGAGFLHSFWESRQYISQTTVKHERLF